MRVELVFHVEIVEDGEVSWWIDTPDLPDLFAVGASVAEARQLALDAIAAEFPDVTSTSERLAHDASMIVTPLVPA